MIFNFSPALSPLAGIANGSASGPQFNLVESELCLIEAGSILIETIRPPFAPKPTPHSSDSPL